MRFALPAASTATVPSVRWPAAESAKKVTAMGVQAGGQASVLMRVAEVVELTCAVRVTGAKAIALAGVTERAALVRWMLMVSVPEAAVAERRVALPAKLAESRCEPVANVLLVNVAWPSAEREETPRGRFPSRKTTGPLRVAPEGSAEAGVSVAVRVTGAVMKAVVGEAARVSVEARQLT